MRALLLTGPPAVGKSTIGRLLAATLRYAAFIDVEDVRHLIVGGHAAPWAGLQGARQQRLGIVNACMLARNLIADGAEVVLADVLTNATAALYRELLSDVLIVELAVDLQEAVRRAEQRREYLTAKEFYALHDQHADFVAADLQVPVSQLAVPEAVAAVTEAWRSS
jgi:predicted kinase